MKSEYLIFEKLKSNLVIEKCNDKNIRIYICQIIGRDTDGYGGYEVNSDMVDFIEANFDVKFSDEGGFQPGFLLPWLMYDCPLPGIIKILSSSIYLRNYYFTLKMKSTIGDPFFYLRNQDLKLFFQE